MQEESSAIKREKAGGEEEEERRLRMKVMKKRDGNGEGRGEDTEYLCAEQKGVQSIIFRQADRAVWGVYFYLDIRGVWMGYGRLVAPFSGGSRTAAVPV